MKQQSLTERKESIYKIKCYILYIGIISILIYFIKLNDKQHTYWFYIYIENNLDLFVGINSILYGGIGQFGLFNSNTSFK